MSKAIMEFIVFENRFRTTLVSSFIILMYAINIISAKDCTAYEELKKKKTKKFVQNEYVFVSCDFH